MKLNQVKRNHLMQEIEKHEVGKIMFWNGLTFLFLAVAIVALAGAALGALIALV